MIDNPKTIEEARKQKYGSDRGLYGQSKYQEGRCAYEVADSLGWDWHQCTRPNGHGVGKLYCKQHAKKVR